MEPTMGHWHPWRGMPGIGFFGGIGPVYGFGRRFGLGPERIFGRGDMKFLLLSCCLSDPSTVTR